MSVEPPYGKRGARSAPERPGGSPRRALGRTETLVVSLLALCALGLAAVGLLWRPGDIPALEGPSPERGGLAPRKIDINSATAEELQLIPGIGPKLSGRIVKYRERNGEFAHVWELERVFGIGPALVEEIERYVVAGRPPEGEHRPVKKIPGTIEE